MTRFNAAPKDIADVLQKIEDDAYLKDILCKTVLVEDLRQLFDQVV